MSYSCYQYDYVATNRLLWRGECAEVWKHSHSSGRCQTLRTQRPQTQGSICTHVLVVVRRVAIFRRVLRYFNPRLRAPFFLDVDAVTGVLLYCSTHNYFSATTVALYSTGVHQGRTGMPVQPGFFTWGRVYSTLNSVNDFRSFVSSCKCRISYGSFSWYMSVSYMVGVLCFSIPVAARLICHARVLFKIPREGGRHPIGSGQCDPLLG